MGSKLAVLAMALIALWAVSPLAAQDETAPLVVDPLANAPFVLQARHLRGLPGEVASQLLRAAPGGSLAIEINAQAIRQGQERTAVFYQIEIDGASLLDQGQGARGRVEVFVYALGEAQRLADFTAQAFTVDNQTLGEAIWQSGLRFQGELSLEPGTYRLRCLVRESASKAVGLRELVLEVPPRDAPLFLSAPLFEDSLERDGWIPVRGARKVAGQQIVDAVPELVASLNRSTSTHALQVGSRPIVPAGLPVLIAERPSLAYFLVQGKLEEPAVTVELVAREGTRIPVRLGPTERVPLAGIADSELLRLAVTVPALQPGRYRLVGRVAGKETPARDVLVLARETRERELYWTDLQWRQDAPPIETPTQSAATGDDAEKKAASSEGKIKAREIENQYRQVLAEWEIRSKDSDAPFDAVLARSRQIARLLQLEGKVLAGDPRRALAQLRDAEHEVARSLIAWDPEAVVPLIHLHFEAYLAYRQRQNFALLTHSRMTVEYFIDLYLQGAKNSEGAKRLAATALAGLALKAEEGSLAASGQRLYRRALALDPSSRPALLGLASSEHRQNHMAEAQEALGRLVEFHGDFAEGYLRQGILALRMGRENIAASALDKAATLAAPDWVAGLIRQGRARVAIGAKAIDAAASYLAPQPTELGEVALAAYLADRQNEIRKSTDLARGVPTTKEPSARLLFDSVPPDEQKAVREILAAAAEQRLPITQEWAAKSP